VPDEHRSKPVRCYQCKQVFSATPPAPETEDIPLPDFDAPPESDTPLPCRLEVGWATSRGRVRDRNEDSCLVQQRRWVSDDVVHEAALLVVADGMGGYQAGDRASRLVVQTAARQLAPLLGASLDEGATGGAPEGGALIDRAIKEANRVVYHQATSDPACKGMGATAALVLVREREVLIGHIGDCRVYQHRGGQVTQVTKDQTLVARMVELGQITPEQALKHPARNEVTQAVGKRATIDPGHYRLELALGDKLVIASDGLHTHVDRATLQEALNEEGRSALRLAEHLVDLANQLGGSDNCTVVAACCY
jgi:protein phosphatase